jgi:asparagine synthase (glutamine-hydrolysing)
MCGLIGSVNHEFSFETVNRHMGHRGPDARNGYRDINVQLYHLRLSIQDVEGGHQPMALHDRYVIIYNGEIYNHTEIRKAYDLPVTTNSDTEVLLLLYEKMGSKMLDLLDGMFAIAIYDKQEKTIFLARDRAGKKPLHIYKNNGRIVFASELNCLAALLPLEKDTDAIASYLRLGYFYHHDTPYQHVRELGNGEFALIHTENTTISYQQWWNISDYYSRTQQISLESALEEVDKRLHTSVYRRMDASDLEVGSFLSGGIDSGLVTAIASKYSKDPLRTFTVSFDGAYDESALAQLVATRYNTRHEQIRISFDDLPLQIESIISQYGEPFMDSSAIPSYYVSAAAKKHITVVLNGDGADELFGGYRRYVPFARYDFFNKPQWLTSGAAGLQKLLPINNEKKSVYNYLYRLTDFMGKKEAQIYLSAAIDVFEGYESALTSSVLSQKFVENFQQIKQGNFSGLQKILLLDFQGMLFGDLLVKMDIATMAHSLEGRSPLLGKELLEFAPTLPDHLKIKGKTTKFLLRQLAKRYLPDELINQPKRGFEIPLKSWVNGLLSDFVQDQLRPNDAYCRNYIDSTFLNNLLADKVRVSAEKRAKMLWCLAALETWHRHTKRIASVR